jgi:hypothetical protein
VACWAREIRLGKVTVKNMRTGEQTTVSPSMAAREIRDGIDLLRGGTPIREPADQD